MKKTVKTKLVVLDMEGTIFRSKVAFNQNGKEYIGGVWTLLCDILGEDASLANKKNYERFIHRNDPGQKSDYYGYFRFVEDTILLHQRHNLTKSQFYYVINSVSYFAGVCETISRLKENGIRVAMITGGLKALADRVVWDHGIDTCHAAAEYFWDGEELKRWSISPTDFEHKRALLEMLHNDLGIAQEEIIFVGDGDNDQHIAAYCKSIAFNPTGKELHNHCSAVITQEPGKEDLSAILDYINW
ncbi:MAG: HAD family hydrolase [Trichlorobacter sp.]|uniref:HAD family hydrolase n=1 Tax=Trichlorobacter sp. TaxID=2911007 RepID=UPI002564D9C0|nr:HAD family hydrolase [Trichlorobacter sp.]MDK9719368.1 HAD family hydrolase [Trichlorobacter sp.]